MLAQKSLGWRKYTFPLDLTYTFTDAQFLETREDLADPIFGVIRRGDAVPFIPTHQLRLSAGVDRQPFSLLASFLFVGATSEGKVTQGGGEVTLRTDNLTVFDLVADWDVGKVLLPGARVYVNARNVLNDASIVSRRPFGARPNAPRWVQVGLRWTGDIGR